MKKKTEHIIDVTNLTKRYKKAEKNSLDDVSFYVEKGAFFSLLGPNGAGKTTTLSILNTTLNKTAGSSIIDGFDVDSQASQVRKRIGVIFQNPSLDINLTAEENVRFHANLYGLYTFRPSFTLMEEAYQKRVHKLAGLLGLKNDLFQPVKSLSGGMKRKLEIIRGLMHSPKVLFLDEPTTGLDPISRYNLWQYLQEIRSQEKVTIFLTTHYLEEAEGSDYICIINNGKIVSKGTPEEIKSSLIQRYIEVDAKNRSELAKELKARGYTFIHKGPFCIEMNSKSPEKVIQSIQTPLTFLKIHNPTLEQAYVKIIKEA